MRSSLSLIEAMTLEGDSSGRPYAAKPAKWLGLAHILCGSIVLAIDMFFLLHGDEQTFGIFASVVWILSGGFGVGGAVSRTRCMVVATMVSSRGNIAHWIVLF